MKDDRDGGLTGDDRDGGDNRDGGLIGIGSWGD
jgi:hypothetical protein